MVSKDTVISGKIKWYVEKRGEYKSNRTGITFDSKEAAPLFKKFNWNDKDKVFVIIERDSIHIFRNLDKLNEFKKSEGKIELIEKKLETLTKLIQEKIKK